MIKRLSALVVLLAMLLLHIQVVSAQTYLFRLDRSDVNVYINDDGSASIEYVLEFYNDPGADLLDFVDVGLPNDTYSLADIRAEIDGKPVESIGVSPYVTPGVEIALGANVIPPGQSGKLQVWISSVRDMLYPGTEKETEPYASFQFSPTYFGKEYVSGSTDLTVTLHLPPGISTKEPRYYPPKNWPGAESPESGYDAQGRVYYRWHSDQANGFSKYTFGAAFPARLVPEGSIIEPPPFSLGISSDDLCCAGFFLAFFGVFCFVIYASIRGSQRRRLQYLPPKVSIEGHGIKRGLTSVEAAVLLQQPADKLLTMILFSTIKKGAAAITSREPLKLDAITTPPPDTLLAYEKEFLNIITAGAKATQRKALQNLLIDLINSVSQKMKGFSLKETVTYYEDIIRRAWEQVETAETPEVKMEKYDEYMGWTMLDRKADDRTRDVFGSGPVFVPIWWGRFDPTYSSPAGGGKPLASPAPSGSGRPISLPHLPGSDFAASMVRGVQSFSAGAIGNLTAFTDGITQKTNPPPPTTSSGRSGGGRSAGCACACACAGCACACAGGGR